MDIKGEIQALEAHSRDVLANSEAINKYLRTLKQCQIQRDAILRTSQAATASASRMRHRVPSTPHAATPLPSARERSSLKITPSIKKPKQTRRTRKNKILDIIDPGSTIHLKKNPDITATVQDDGSILYDGLVGSLSKTARQAVQSIRQKKSDKANYDGWNYWCYEGTPLTKLDDDFP